MSKKNWDKLPDFAKVGDPVYQDLEDGGATPKTTSPESANMVASSFAIHNGVTLHKPMIDLDIPAQLVPSSTPGHSHLYIDKVLNQEQYGKLLEVLVEVGIVQEGIIENQWRPHGSTYLRLPGVQKKPSDASSSSGSPEMKLLDPSESYSVSLPSSEPLKINIPTSQTHVFHNSTEDVPLERLAKIASQSGLNLMEIVIAYKALGT